MGLFLRYSAKEELEFAKQFELDEVVPPEGYPYKLFQVLAQGGKKEFYVLAKTKEQAEELVDRDRRVKATLTLVPDLVKILGHTSTHGFLRYFGDRWIVKKGIAFYGHGPSVF